MIIWINGAFGSGKTTTAYELQRRINGAYVYDPENFGFFIRKNSPKELFSEGDFQDIPLWREVNFKMLDLLSTRYDGIIIVPMTLCSRDYYDGIITRLTDNGADVRHFILYTGKETILRRLRLRRLRMPGKDSFAEKSIGRCIHAFDNIIMDEKIITDGMNVDEVVEEIAKRSGVKLLTDKRTEVRKLLDRIIVLIKHIR